jgi:ribosomal protein S27E
MVQTPSFSGLEGFARKTLDADRHPGDYHRFRLVRCPTCGVVPFALTIEHHTGSRKGNFKGRILGRCSDCNQETRIFSFTGEHRKFLREEKPRCRCGSRSFFAGECERIERDEGLMGFFDEGVLVGQCAECGRNRALVHTD